MFIVIAIIIIIFMVLTIWTIISLSADRTGANESADGFPRIWTPI